MTFFTSFNIFLGVVKFYIFRKKILDTLGDALSSILPCRESAHVCPRQSYSCGELESFSISILVMYHTKVIRWLYCIPAS